MASDLFARRQTNFVLRSPGGTENVPQLLIGMLQPRNSPALAKGCEIPLRRVPNVTGLWEVPARACDLRNGAVYCY